MNICSDSLFLAAPSSLFGMSFKWADSMSCRVRSIVTVALLAAAALLVMRPTIFCEAVATVAWSSFPPLSDAEDDDADVFFDA